MLYDPKWEAPTKAEPMTLPHLIAWLETKPPAKEYKFWNCRGACLMGQYLRQTAEWTSPNIRATSQLQAIVAFPTPWTFGAALERARKALDAKRC